MTKKRSRLFNFRLLGKRPGEDTQLCQFDCSMPELAPEGCVVCGKERPEVDHEQTWRYIADATPAGALACSDACLSVALERHQKTGRVD